MTEEMESLLSGLRERSEREHWNGAWSVEAPCCEYYLQSFVTCDIRPDFRMSFVPLYYYLYHDYIMTQAMFAPAPNPYFLVLKFARSFVLGDVMGCHMGAGGRLQNWEPPRGTPWMEWDKPAGDQDAAYAVLQNATILRRGVGKAFLLFGRMLRPIPVNGVRNVAWTLDNEAHDIPALEHGTWQAPDGRVAIAVANWTDQEQPATLDLRAFAGRSATWHVARNGVVVESSIETGREVPLALLPHTCALLVMT